MKVTVRHPAAEGERLEADAFEAAIGTDVAFRQGTARLVAAVVADDGMSVEFILEIEDPPTPEEKQQ